MLDHLRAHDDIHRAARLVVIAQIAQLDWQAESFAPKRCQRSRVDAHTTPTFCCYGKIEPKTIAAANLHIA